MARSARRPGRELVEGNRGDARRQRRQVCELRRPPDDLDDRDLRNHPVPGIEPGGDRLGAVDCGPDERPFGSRRSFGSRRHLVARSVGQQPRQDPAPDPITLRRRLDEQHREIPRRSASIRRSEPKHRRIVGRARCRHEEELRVSRTKVGEQPPQRLEIARLPRLVESMPVVIADPRGPDMRAGRQVVVARVAVRDRFGQAGSSTDAIGWPAARRSSSACMNTSRSPSRTPAVFDVSTPVRRSLTIWYGCRT